MYRFAIAAVSLTAIFASVCMADEPAGDRYLLTEHWGGTWSDAEKDSGSYDDNMCWAAAASNVLDWTGWGHVEGMTNADEIFQYFQSHWYPGGGSPNNAWQWWFDDNQVWTPWVVYAPGGGFYPDLNINDYYTSSGAFYGGAMAAVNGFLHDGSAMATTLFNSSGLSAHVVTLWGINTTNDGQDYLGLWITDSDDSEADPDMPNLLQYYEVEYVGGRWYFQDFYGLNTYFIGPVHALEPIWLSMTPGDANCDGTVDLDDFGIIKINFGLSGGWTDGDFNRNGVIDLDDFGMLKNNFGGGVATAVPEPASVALLLAGGFALLRRRRCTISP